MISNKVKKVDRVSFELVEPKVLELTSQIGASQSLDEQLLLLEEIDEYIKLCGWTLDEWREESLRRIDGNWDEDKSWLN